jgi:NTP pyrophosphatase (non-canonical NTP hydrolase)
MTTHLISANVLDNIRDEAQRAHDKKGADSMYWPRASNDRRLAVLAEETGEVARAINDGAAGTGTDLAALRAELVQVAAMAATFIQSLDDGLAS